MERTTAALFALGVLALTCACGSGSSSSGGDGATCQAAGGQCLIGDEILRGAGHTDLSRQRRSRRCLLLPLSGRELRPARSDVLLFDVRRWVHLGALVHRRAAPTSALRARQPRSRRLVSLRVHGDLPVLQRWLADPVHVQGRNLELLLLSADHQRTNRPGRSDSRTRAPSRTSRRRSRCTSRSSKKKPAPTRKSERVLHDSRRVLGGRRTHRGICIPCCGSARDCSFAVGYYLDCGSPQRLPRLAV